MRARAFGPHRRPERIERRLVNRLSPVSPDVAALLDMQRSAGNASVTRLLARQVAPADPYTSWTKAEIRPIQRELRFGFMEELDAAKWTALTQEMVAVLTSRGFREDNRRAAGLFAASGRAMSGDGRFFVRISTATSASSR